MRIQVPLVIGVTGEQAKQYADEYGPSSGQNARSYVLTFIQDPAACGEAGGGTRGATVSIKRQAGCHEHL